MNNAKHHHLMKIVSTTMGDRIHEQGADYRFFGRFWWYLSWYQAVKWLTGPKIRNLEIFKVTYSGRSLRFSDMNSMNQMMKNFPGGDRCLQRAKSKGHYIGGPEYDAFY